MNKKDKDKQVIVLIEDMTLHEEDTLRTKAHENRTHIDAPFEFCLWINRRYAVWRVVYKEGLKIIATCLQVRPAKYSVQFINSDWSNLSYTSGTSVKFVIWPWTVNECSHSVCPAVKQLLTCYHTRLLKIMILKSSCYEKCDTRSMKEINTSIWYMMLS